MTMVAAVRWGLALIVLALVGHAFATGRADGHLILAALAAGAFAWTLRLDHPAAEPPAPLVPAGLDDGCPIDHSEALLDDEQ